MEDLRLHGLIGGKKPKGDALFGDVLSGKTFSNADDVGLVGSMLNRGSEDVNASLTGEPAIAEGYRNGLGKVLRPTFSPGSEHISISISSLSTTTTSFVKRGAFTVLLDGQYTIGYTLSSNGGSWAKGRIYKNGVAHGSIYQTQGTLNVTQNLSFNAGDTVELWLSIEVSHHTCFGHNFRVMANVSMAARTF